MKAKRRALYLYKCIKCGFKRSSRIYTRASEEVCAKCRREATPENQPSLFTEPITNKMECPNCGITRSGELSNGFDCLVGHYLCKCGHLVWGNSQDISSRGITAGEFVEIKKTRTFKLNDLMTFYF